MDALAGDQSRWQEKIENDERCQELVELAPDGIFVHDGKRILLANAAALRLAGATTRNEVVGHSIDQFLMPPYLKAFDTSLHEASPRLEQAIAIRDTFRRVDGTELQVEVRAVAYLDRELPSVHLVVRDLTGVLAAELATRQINHRLQQAQKMEAVGALAGGMAHEVNNMMAVVLGFGNFLVEDARLPAECLADIHEMIKAGSRAAAIAQQLLAFSRKAIHRPEATNLSAAVRNAEPVLRRLVSEARNISISPIGNPIVWIDSGQLDQVVINLVMNARDATVQGGEISIVTSVVTVAGEVKQADGSSIPPGEYAVLSVKDDGIGMDAETQCKIFEPFFTTKPVGLGTGLGLAAAQGIMMQSNGYIGLTSAPGVGSTFSLYLPIYVAADLAFDIIAQPPRHVAPYTHRGAVILVVDDEVAVRRVAARSLEREGFHVIQAADAAEAVDSIAKFGLPRLVLTDIMMPGITGVELARRLKLQWPALPIVFMSGYSADELQRQGFLDEKVVLLQKPFSSAALLATVDREILRMKD